MEDLLVTIRRAVLSAAGVKGVKFSDEEEVRKWGKGGKGGEGNCQESFFVRNENGRFFWWFRFWASSDFSFSLL